MYSQRLCRAGGVLFVALVTAASGPRAGAQGLSDGDTALLNRLLGSGVLGAAVAAAPIADPAKLVPLQPATWAFQVTSGTNQGASETDTLQANTQPNADSQWQYQSGQKTIYDLSKAADGSIVSPASRI